MANEAILTELAPCGLNCARCFNYSSGPVKRLSGELLAALEGFDGFADRLAKFENVFYNYPAFRELLTVFASTGCEGCRRGNAKFPDCSAKDCHKEKGVDFCYQCDEYPCVRNKFDPELYAKWIAVNNRIKAIGIEAYYEEQAQSPRY